MATETVHLAYAGLDSLGLSKDVSMLLDGDDFDLSDTVKLQDKLQHFLFESGLLRDSERLVITG